MAAVEENTSTAPAATSQSGEQNGGSSLASVERIFTYPLVSDAYAKGTQLYDSVKESNALVGGTMNMAEQGLNKVMSLGKPLTRAVEPGVKLVDGMVCHQVLARVETAFPQVRTPTETLTADAWKLYDAAAGVGTLPLQYTKSSLHLTMSLPRRLASKTLEYADYYTDYYLTPEEADDETEGDESATAAATTEEHLKEPASTVANGTSGDNLLEQSRALGCKVNARLLRRARRLTVALRKRGELSLDNARQHLRALEQLTQVMNGVQELSNELVDRLTRLTGCTKKEDTESSATPARLDLSRLGEAEAALKEKAKYYVELLSHVATVVSGMIFERLDDSKRETLSKAKDNLAQILAGLNDKSRTLNADFFALSQSSLNLVQSLIETGLQKLQQYNILWVTKETSSVELNELIGDSSSETPSETQQVAAPLDDNAPSSEL